jgi:hypothetical protein
MSATVVEFPRSRAIDAGEREAIVRFCRERRGVSAEFSAADDGREYVVLSLVIPGGDPESSPSFHMVRQGRQVALVAMDSGAVVVRPSPSVGTMLEAFATLLPGALIASQTEPTRGAS